MRQLSIVCAAFIVGLGVVALARQAPAPQQPVFKSAVDVVQLDVSVLDKNRQPVHGLTASDFTILEDGKPQGIVGFSAVDMPDAVAPTTPWLRDVTPDVTSNEIDNHRIFVLVLDDATSPTDLWAIHAIQNSAKSIINKMVPGDLATVIFTRANQNSQDLTGDHAKLFKAVDTFSQLGADSKIRVPKIPAPPRIVPCGYFIMSVQVLQRAAEYLAAIPNRRKTLVYVSAGVPVDVGRESVLAVMEDSLDPHVCGVRIVELMKDVFRDAQRANVNIYSIDPMGLRADAHLDNWEGRSVEYLQTMAENTGGRAIVNTNDFEPGIAQMFRENNSYYLLGYQPSNVKADGTFRRIDVKVDRPGVDVWTRKNYYAPLPEKAVTSVNATPPPSAAVKSMAEILPNADLPLRATAAPFVLPDGSGSRVAIALGLRHAAPDERVPEQVDVLINAFTPEGVARGTAHQSATLNVSPAHGGTDARYDVLSSIDLKPGRYELRMSAHSTAFDTRGSLYLDVDVPDVARAPLSLSGVVVSALPSPPSAPRNAVADLVPIVPTTSREFAPSDRVTTFLRVYETGKAATPASLAMHLVDAHGATTFERTQALGADQFNAIGTGAPKITAADVKFDVPLTTLTPGDYLLTFEATLGKTSARRDVRFTIK